MAKIKIDLSKTGDISELNFDELFQPEAWDSVRKKLKERLQKLAKNESQPSQDSSSLFQTRQHDSLFISGGRGSGKTIFLRNILEHIRTENDEDWYADYCVLPVLDPTLMESKEHVFVTVLSLLKEKVDKHRQTDCDSQHEKREIFNKRLNKLAGGLSQIDGIGNGDPYGEAWEDALYVMRTGLKKAMQGFDFEKNFNVLLEAALDYLNKKAFVLAFDDVDTNFERGWPILECIRKYLTHPAMVTILAGDLRLLSFLIRGKQLETFSQTALEHDRPNTERHTKIRSWSEDSYIQQLNKLEDQYLVKVLKPENRIMLSPLLHIQEKNELVVVSNDGDERPVTEVLDHIAIELLGLRQLGDLDLFRRAILKLPVRSVWQFFVACHPLFSEITEEINIADIRTANIQILSSALLDINVDAQSLSGKQNGLVSISTALGNWLQQYDRFQPVYRLMPDKEDEQENGRVIALRIFLTAAITESPGLFFQWMVSTGIAHHFYELRFDKMDIIRQNLGIYMQQNAVTAARKAVAAAWQISGQDRDFSCYGAIRLLNDGANERRKGLYDPILPHIKIPNVVNIREALEEGKDFSHLSPYLENVQALKHVQRNNSYGCLDNSIEGLRNKCQDRRSLISLILVEGRSVATGRDEKRKYLSILPLIGYIAELFGSRDETNSYFLARRISHDEEIVPQPLEMIQQDQRTTAISKKTARIDDETDLDEEDQDDIQEPSIQDNTGNSWKDFLEEWRKQAKEVVKGSDLTIDLANRILSRTLTGFRRLDAETEPQNRYAGFLIHRQIAIFLNAVLIEEAREKEQEESLRFIHPTKSDQVLLHNYLKLDHLENLPLSRAMISFPVFGMFLEPELSGKTHQGINLANAHIDHVISFLSLDETKALDYRLSQFMSFLVHKKVGIVEFTGFYDLLNTVTVAHIGTK